MSDQNQTGHIITFYSYKGGTGRTMMLANVAWILASAGKRVLAIDWDLEAPGLHQYFRPFLIDPRLEATDGLIDLVVDYANEAVTPLDETDDADWLNRVTDVKRYVVSINWHFPRSGQLHLLPAGRQNASYAVRVNSFEWRDFYERLKGGALLELLKEKIRQDYDYILIDSRTGVSDTSGICTVQMPEQLVVCFTGSEQNIWGSAAVAASVKAQWRRLDADDRDSQAGRGRVARRIFPIFTRIEHSEKDKLDAARAYVRLLFRPILDRLPAEEERYWNRVEVAYWPYYAFEEVLAVFGDKFRTETSLLVGCETVADLLTDGEVKEFALPDSAERERVLHDFTRHTADMVPSTTESFVQETGVPHDAFKGRVIRIKVYLSAPGDVNDERTLARRLIKEELPYDPYLRHRIAFDLVSLDDPAAPVPMLATLMPQEVANQRDKPSTCDIMVVILWSRLGTPLPDTFTKPNGERYLSGTEWEVEDALNAHPQPAILIYRRTEESKVALRDPALSERLRQYQLVEQFFERFGNTDGSLRGGVSTYRTPTEFKELLASHLKQLLRDRVADEFEKDPSGHRIRPLTDVPAAVDIAPWLEALLERTGYIEISGIGSGVGQTKDASRYPIEQLYTALRSQDPAENLAGRSSLADLMSRHRLLLIEGQPGAGKTTFLRMVATMLARDRLGIPCPDKPSWREKHLGMDSRAKLRAPLFLNLSQLATLLAEPRNLESSDDRRRLLDLLARTASAADNEEWRNHWEGLLARGEAILLLDGLDEVADDRLRERVFAIFRDACRLWVKSPVVVTSRPFGAEAVRNIGFHHAVIEDFGKEEVREFIERWVAALHNLPIGQRPKGVAGEKSDRMIQAVLGRPAIRRLAANPVMLTCLCVVHWNEGDLPEGRARLYRAVIRWLIAARTPQREQAGFTDQFAREAFAMLAFAMMGGAKGATVAVADLEVGAEAVLPLVERHFPKEIGIRRARDWLRYECLWSGIVEESTAGKVHFWHLTFQEYLAAQELAWRRDREGAEDWWPMVRGRLDDLQWRETVDVLPGVLFDEGGSGRVDLLLRRVIELREKKPSLATDARFFGIVGRILGPMIAYSYKPSPEIERLYQELRDRILPMFGRDGAAKVPVKTRIEAAEALGRGGDPRLQGDTLIEVPDTGGVSLGKYPVTVTEYQAFVDAGGYHDSSYWDGVGWQLRKEQQWEEPDEWDRQLEHPNLPVTGVSWYEARAYCRWRSSDSVWTVRLPKAAEWQAAATPDGRMYPWGSEEPDPERVNFVGMVGTPTPVGVYPAGDGRYGHCDLAGNVWEWMEDVRHATGGAGFTDSVRNCGGSWNDSPWELRCAFGRWNIPGLRTSEHGFRVARTLD